MFPGIYEFRWEAGHILFLCAFYSVITLLVLTLALALRRAVEDLREERAGGILWNEDFRDLSPAARVCRHTLTGELRGRICPNGFDCRHCSTHEKLLARWLPTAPEPPVSDECAGGFRVFAGRLYHRGHTWVRPEPDGTVSVGLDDLAERLLEGSASAVLPKLGTRLQAHGIGWRMRTASAEFRVLCPIEGVVVDRGGPERGWYLRLRPENENPDDRHLLRGAEVGPWLQHELKRLRNSLANTGVGESLLNGGPPAANLSAEIPKADRDRVIGEAFLDP